MKTRYKVRIIGLCTIAFLLLNACLISFDRDSEVERKSYINEWSESFTYDLYETINTKGVFTASDTNAIYFDQQTGAFQEFLVEESDEISEGDELYTYEVVDYNTQVNKLESEASRLEEEITSIETYINELEGFTIPESEAASLPSFPQGSEMEGDNNPFLSPAPSTEDRSSQDRESQPQERRNTDSTVEMEFMKEQALAEKELKLSQKQAQLTMIEDQLGQLEETGQTITVTSEFSGVVTDLSENLKSPLLTLSSSNLMVSGELSENHRKLVEQGMNSLVRIPDLNIELPGTIETIHPFPEKIDVNRTSDYPYEVIVDGESEEIKPGYHADVEIITDKAIDTVAAFDDLLMTNENTAAWIMNERGRLEERQLKTGITEDGIVQVIEGLENNEHLADQPVDEFRKGAVFFTPLKLSDLQMRDLFHIDPSLMLDYGLLGLMNR
ncbi:efflux RND transporter periplasmic adaptor subunit [Halobacillus shinanisalinarum]|uniref:Efflux RND transporter periplasmic adaptor subunit n=1 Tax=Halobacillus shinanisalinarum TaxID=2932258 RepID=A0ABY4GUT4_9BACI|nr:HlyD family efflux transporter periplasmic adaptor subunit [Halobacillus shinanisalinarum]UOQ91779.1 efflux RND transporter periplasmic adaptor subunit [Halobacillus shinanisalinarum]